MTADDKPDREVTTELSAGLARWLPVSLSIRRTVTERWAKRGAEFSQSVGQYADATPDEVEERLGADERLGDSYFTAGEKAVRSSDAEFRGALARLVAAGLRDDALVDEVAYFVSVLSQLEPAHLRLLAALDEAGQRSETRAVPSVRYVGLRAGMAPHIASSAAERLHSLSLITDRLDGEMLSWGQDTLGFFGVTDAGLALLRYCEQMERGTTPGAG